MYTCIDLFSGAGGFALGFKQVGFKILAASDIWEIASKTYIENHKGVNYLLKDINELNGSELLELAGISRGEVDVIIGGPPCQGFSTVGKRDEEDPRNLLFKEYVRIVDEVSPKCFVMENVVGITNMNGGDIYKNIFNLFEEIGYKLECRILNAVDYGVPQNRERAIFIGTRLNVKLKYPEKTHSDSDARLKPYMTLGDAIGDLPNIKSQEKSERYDKPEKNNYQKLMREGVEKLSLHSCGKHSDKLLEMMNYIKEGSSVWESEDIPIQLKPTSGYGNTYARLDSKVPGMTITRNFNCISSSRCIHPKSNRGLTAREAARIQSFPDKYQFLGNKSEIALQIGNAVPPLLAENIAIAIKKILEAP